MLSRRAFLIGLGTLGLAQWLSGCSNREIALQVLLLKSSIPTQLISLFDEKINGEKNLSFKPEAQLKDVFKLLQDWQEKRSIEQSWLDWLPIIGKRTPMTANLVTLGDYWLAEAIAKKLIQPLSIDDLTGWQQLPPRWQTLVKRNQQGDLDEKGQIWGAPYRWGTTAIAYRQDEFEKLGWNPSDWQDLWREELRDRISLPDQMREVIGLTLKKLGYSYNSPDLSQISNLPAELLSLHQQVKFYSSDRYLQPLVLGDTWLAVGWSSDILATTSLYKNIKAVIPRSGTALWADVWVQPASIQETGDRASILKKWIDFCWQAQSASLISQFTHAVSPAISNLKAEQLPQDIRQNPLLSVDSQIFDNCEFLAPLSPQAQTQYENLWRQMRQGR
jgi:putative spermidine/putrescine transport system substrate-binding protein